MKRTKKSLTRSSTMERQPLWATICLTIIVLSCVVGIFLIRTTVKEIPIGLMLIAQNSATAIVMSAGRRRV